MTSWPTPTDPQIDRAVGRLTRPELSAYFFRNLKNPLWLGPLRQRGFFALPPAPEPSEKGMYSPPWPPADYLIQVAEEVPDDVAAIITSIDTTNWIVQLALIDAALKLPASTAAPLALRFGSWMRQEYRHPLLHDRLTSLVVRLARGGESNAAIDLARRILAIRPPKPRESDSYFPSDPTGLVDHWDYREMLQQAGPALGEAGRSLCVAMLFDLLRTAVKYGIRANREPGDDKTEDFSHWWRPAVEDHAQNATGDVRDTLIEALRDQLLALISVDPGALKSTWHRLLAEPYAIFHRIAIYLLTTADDPPSDLLDEAVFQHDWFDRPIAYHEYYHLMQKHFGNLPLDRRTHYLEMITRTAHEATEKEYIDWWEYRQLWPLREYLDASWKARLIELQRLGELEHPDFLSFTSTGTGGGPRSPKTREQLRAMTEEELVSFLMSWEPPKDSYTEPSQEGLAQELVTLAQDDPAHLAAIALRFNDLRVDYARALVEGLQGAVKSGRKFDWAPVLRLGQALASRDKRSDELRYALLRLSWLLSSGLEKGEGEIPIDLRAQLWEVIALLAEYPDPSLDAEGDDDTPPSHRSLNTVRGEAIHACIRYGLWVRRCQEGREDSHTLIGKGFHEMPELSALLQEHLDVSQDRSLAIRAVYGQWLPWLRLLDASWTASHLDSILPTDRSLQPYRQAAWETYITFSPPYTGMLSLLKEEYRRAVRGLAELPKTKPERSRDVTSRLAEHLATFYWRGEEALDGEASLIAEFYAVAPGWLRGRLAEFVGRSLKNTKEPVPEAVEQRLMALWDSRLSALAESMNPEDKQDELDAFMWWVSSGKLPQAWVASRLARVAELIPHTGPETMFALEQIVILAPGYPSEIVSTVANLVGKDKDLWHTSAWAGDIAEILRQLKASGKKEVEVAVGRIADTLGRRGFLQFREFANI